MTRKFTTSSFEGHTLAKDYYVMGTLGEGSLGKVKVAIHLVTQTLVAIKILKKGTSTEPLISCEVELLKTIQHPHIVQLLQVIETKQKTYLVMECATRGSLFKRVTQYGHLDEEEARTLFRELTSAIKYIHSHNIAHRDIKPENILLDSEGHIKLSDFGLGKIFTSGEKARGFWGTAEYCAPEVFGYTEYEGLPTDIWSLGVVLYFLVTGYLPFREAGHSEIKSQILARNCWIPPHLSPELQDLLNQLMTVDPTQRPCIVEITAHPWLGHEEDSLISLTEIPREPDPNLAFQMFSMGYKIQEIKTALNQKIYTRAMATYLILQKKQRQHRIDHDGEQDGTMAPEKTPNLPLPLRRGSSAPSLTTSTLSTLPELPGDERKGCRTHSEPLTSSSLKRALREKNSKREPMPHLKTAINREIEFMSSSATTSSTSIFSKVSNYESTESSKTIDTGISPFSQGFTTSMSSFSSEQAQGESCPSSRERNPQKHFRGWFQGVPRVPRRQRGRKSLKKRISQALRSLCCCPQMTRRQHVRKIKVMAANEEGHGDRDTG
ncbi:AABR07054286.1 [Phodopus roborovskii]|uniref:non-specific serine/threonine protein kinase n=1 Tax=Phodopus roborovskii TaxID=109678 RepID=A0AAU9Z6W9_PHORO|nr:AABR07054286.1 [Phodopus roborovskii]